MNIDNNTENGSDVTRGHMYNITDLIANSSYTISVQTVVNGTKTSYSDPISMNVTAGKFIKRHLNVLTFCMLIILVHSGCVPRIHTPDDQVYSGKRCLYHNTTSSKINIT